MSSSRGTTPDMTIQIYEDPDSSDRDTDLSTAPNDTSPPAEPHFPDAEIQVDDSRDGSDTEVVDEGEESCDEHQTGALYPLDLDVVKSIEEDPVFEVSSYSNDRTFSSTTAIHLGTSFGDPFLDNGYDHGLGDLYEEDTDGEREHGDLEYDSEHGEDRDSDEDNEEQFGMGSQADSIGAISRKISEFSTLPDELEVSLPEAPSPPVWAKRSFRPITASPNSSARGNRLLSSPQNGHARHFSPSASNAKENRFVSSPLARKSPSSAAFRNSSSVRAMQLSSPSPPPSSGFAQSPRSARKRRLGLEGADGSSRNVTPSRGHQLRHPSRMTNSMDGTPTSSKQITTRKEYPLVLLHCSFSSSPLPYSPSVLRAALPEDTQESLNLLREKLGLTVLERGILVPHPGEDYELLEERILESLELKAPRLGKCGHFVGSSASRQPSQKNRAAGADATEPPNKAMMADMADAGSPIAHPKCETCGNHVADQHRGCEGDGYKRWDIRVYASNGLMRAGAWSAAWREMEKVDVEIGVWLSEELRAILEHKAQAEYEHGDDEDQFAYDMAPEDEEMPRHVQHQPQSHGEAFAPPSRPAYEKAQARSASTAACSRPSSSDRRRRYMKEEPVPLSTLLLNFIKRSIFNRSELLLQALVVILAVALFRQWQTQGPSPSLAMHNMEQHNQQAMEHALPVQQEVTEAAAPVAHKPLEATPEPTPDKQDDQWTAIPACVFPAGDEGKAGMTALPADLARIVLSSATELTYEAKTWGLASSPVEIQAIATPVDVVEVLEAVIGEA